MAEELLAPIGGSSARFASFPKTRCADTVRLPSPVRKFSAESEKRNVVSSNVLRASGQKLLRKPEARPEPRHRCRNAHSTAAVAAAKRSPVEDRFS